MECAIEIGLRLCSDVQDCHHISQVLLGQLRTEQTAKDYPAYPLALEQGIPGHCLSCHIDALGYQRNCRDFIVDPEIPGSSCPIYLVGYEGDSQGVSNKNNKKKLK